MSILSSCSKSSRLLHTMGNARITVATSSCKLRFMQRLAPWLCLYAALSASPHCLQSTQWSIG
jgi:hypothetical protein